MPNASASGPNESESAPPAPRVYRTTCWTDVLRAAAEDPEPSRIAFGRLYQDYWMPVCAFIRRQGFTPEETEDLGQDFFLDLFTRNAFQRLKPEHGRFRCFVVAALRHFLANARDRARAQKRGGGCVHLPLEESLVESQMPQDASSAGEGESGFDREWAWTVLRRALANLREEYAQKGRADLFAELEAYLGGTGERQSHAALARQHGITVNAVGVAVHRLHRRFGELLREEIGRTVSDAAEIPDEIRYLREILARQPAPAARSSAPPPVVREVSAVAPVPPL